MQNAPDQVLLVINSGSSSLKFSINKIASPLQTLYRGEITAIGETSRFQVNDHQNNRLHEHPITVSDHAQAVRVLLDWLEKEAANVEIIAAGHRVVHGGIRFHAPVLITEEVIAYLHILIPLAPSHQSANLQGSHHRPATMPVSEWK
ncbi:MAG TPA: hypothetical protein ENG78_06900 [Acidiferrobacteraceae bacterium]|nr:hypothetical protein [Acidiferrobacteraceae bacterium]HEX20528.1 hypothetical protein [Acidiferrobacteraceae bacterium]